jgi:hypothetical protein
MDMAHRLRLIRGSKVPLNKKLAQMRQFYAREGWCSRAVEGYWRQLGKAKRRNAHLKLVA